MDSDLLIPHQEVLAQELEDPEFRREWERTALARWLAIEVVHYRAEHGLSQRKMAEHLGVHQSDVARMELGEHNPSMERLVRVAKALDLELLIDICPEGKDAKLPRKRALRSSSVRSGGCEILLAIA